MRENDYHEGTTETPAAASIPGAVSQDQKTSPTSTVNTSDRHPDVSVHVEPDGSAVPRERKTNSTTSTARGELRLVVPKQTTVPKPGPPSENLHAVDIVLRDKVLKERESFKKGLIAFEILNLVALFWVWSIDTRFQVDKDVLVQATGCNLLNSTISTPPSSPECPIATIVYIHQRDDLREEILADILVFDCPDAALRAQSRFEEDTHTFSTQAYTLSTTLYNTFLSALLVLTLKGLITYW